MFNIKWIQIDDIIVWDHVGYAPLGDKPMENQKKVLSESVQFENQGSIWKIPTGLYISIYIYIDLLKIHIYIYIDLLIHKYIYILIY